MKSLEEQLLLSYFKISRKLKKKKLIEDDDFDDWGDESDKQDDEKYWFTKDKVDTIKNVHNYLDNFAASR